MYCHFHDVAVVGLDSLHLHLHVGAAQRRHPVELIACNRIRHHVADLGLELDFNIVHLKMAVRHARHKRHLEFAVPYLHIPGHRFAVVGFPEFEQALRLLDLEHLLCTVDCILQVLENIRESYWLFLAEHFDSMFNFSCKLLQ